MSQTIHIENRVRGVLTDATLTIGVIRTDTSGIVIADGTTVPRLSLGVYQISFDEPADGLTYEASLVVNGDVPVVWQFEGSSSIIIGGDNMIVVGTNHISSTEDLQGRAKFNIALSTDFSVSDKKFVLGSIPLTLYEDVDGFFALGVILTTGTTSNNVVFFKANRMNLLKNGDDKYILPYFGVTPDESISYFTKWKTVNFKLDANNALYCVEFIPPAVDAEAKVFVGGIPLLAQCYNKNWYLVLGS